MAKRFDPTLKDLLEAGPADWVRFVHLSCQGRVTLIDADVSTITAQSDKVLQVHDPIPWLLHLELQSGRDLQLVDRVLMYNVLLQDRHGKRVRSVIVLLRPAADGPELTGQLQRAFPNEPPYLAFRYGVVRAWQQPLAPILAGGLATLPLAPLCDEAAGQLPGVIQQMEQRVAQAASPDRVNRFWMSTYLLMGLRYPDDLILQLLQGVQGMKESSTYQAILAEGRAEGMAQGLAHEARKFILMQGRKRFGEPDAQAVAILEAIFQLDRLERIGERLLDVSSWAELLATP